MQGLNIAVVASLGAFLPGSASVASDLAIRADDTNPQSSFSCAGNTNHCDPNAPEG
jgi:hypothetical protein